MTSTTQLIQLLLVFGGESSEHAVSIESARNVYKALDKQKYQVHLVYITPEGKWLLVHGIDDTRGDEIRVVMGEKKLLTSAGDALAIDVMFPVLHGKNGEDGTVQGMAKLLHLPCVGPGLIGAAVAMDKDITKRLLRDGGVPVVNWVTWHSNDPMPVYSEVAAKLQSAVLFVKPANAGSSVGVSKVHDHQQFGAALHIAAQHDSFVLIEPAVEAREIEVAVLGSEAPQVSTPGEVIPGDEFYSYDDKYTSRSTATTYIPAELDGELAKRIQAHARQAYLLTRGRGMARVDFFVTATGEVYLNEINSIPGFTNISMYPKLWEYDGVDYGTLLDYLITDAR